MRHCALLAVVLAAACGGCATMESIGNAVMNVNVFSTEDEIEFGQQFSVDIEKELTVLNDPQVQDYVRNLGRRVAAESPRQDVEYVFTVIDSPEEVNAFAVPGGFIYVYSGLLRKLDNEEELTGVLAHEVGHVAARHSMKQLTRQIGFEAITGMILGESPGQMESAASQVANQLGFLHFSREQEREADHLAVDIMTRTGDNPMGLPVFMAKLAEMSGSQPSGVARMLATHPHPEERRNYLLQDIRNRGIPTSAATRPVPAFVKQ